MSTDTTPSRKVPYGIANYAELIDHQSYFVDKTRYIAKLEGIKNPIFLRPRRFGKSLLCSMLRYYYDLAHADRFDDLFGQTWIGRRPTPQHNQYLVLSLDFSTVYIGRDLASIEQSFQRQNNMLLAMLRPWYEPLLNEMPAMPDESPVADNLQRLLAFVEHHKLPPVYVIIDEYDNFANQLVTGRKDQLYRELTAEDSFLKTFFKTLKEGRQSGVIANVFITGVLPILIDELASGFNVGRFLTLEPEFEQMLGFTQQEVDQVLDEVYRDYGFDPATRSEVETLIKNHYNGYHFVDPGGEALYNSTILFYFLDKFCSNRVIPKHLTDLNLKTDIAWVKRLTASNPALTEEFVDRLTIHNTILYDDVFLTEKYNMSQFFEKGYFPISFFYLGMLTRQDDFYLRLPNLNMRTIFVQYFNELHRIDVSTRYTDIMQQFAADLDLRALFAGYWAQYVSQLPEAIFQQVNENFYRTTFYELCSRYLSRWFSWNVERSYPQGRSDLEFVGKYHEQFAGLRYVIEFKYYSNAAFRELQTTIDDFALQDEDTRQIAGYAEGLRQEYPEARIRQFVIYCFGNQGFRVFEVS